MPSETIGALNLHSAQPRDWWSTGDPVAARVFADMATDTSSGATPAIMTPASRPSPKRASTPGFGSEALIRTHLNEVVAEPPLEEHPSPLPNCQPEGRPTATLRQPRAGSAPAAAPLIQIRASVTISAATLAPATPAAQIAAAGVPTEKS
jgi:hypothetical protein